MPSTRAQSRSNQKVNVPEVEKKPVDAPELKSAKSYKSTSSASLKRLKKLQAEKEALEDLAAAKLKILEENMLHKLRLEHEAIDLEEEMASQVSCSRVADWVDTTVVQQAPIIKDVIPPATHKSALAKSFPAPDCVTSSNDIKLLAEAIQKSIQKVTHNSKLPNFDGSPSDWLIFKAAYSEEASHLSITENLLRLRTCLKGEAKNTVSALLITNADPSGIMAALEMRFGNQHYIVTEQLQILNNLPRVSTAETQSLAHFTCTVNNCITTIKAMQKHEMLFNPELYSAIIKKLDPIMLNKWYEYADSAQSNNSPLISLLTSFLQKETARCIRFAPYSLSASSSQLYLQQSQADLPTATSVLQQTTYQQVPATCPQPAIQQQLYTPARNADQRNPINTMESSGTKTISCPLCSCSHFLSNCSEFLNKTVDERYQWIKDNRFCFRCISYKHNGKNCKLSKYLHKLLRKEKVDSVLPKDQEHSHKLNNCNSENNNQCKTFLKILPVTIMGPNKSVKTYALLDEGATITLVNEDLAQEIGVDGASSPLHLQGLGFSCTENSKRVKITISGKHSQSFNIHAWTKKSLELGLQTLDRTEFVQYQHIKDLDNVIDWQTHCIPKILIGQDNWPLIVTRELHSGKDSEPVASKTALGWVLHGCISNFLPNTVYRVENLKNFIYKVENFQSTEKSLYKVFSENVVNDSTDEFKHQEQCMDVFSPENDERNDDEELYQLIKRSFDLDNLGIQFKDRHNPAEETALNTLENTTRRIESNTWETGLLWKTADITLPDAKYSYKMALKRFTTLEKKLKGDPALRMAYTQQMQKLFDNNYAVVCQPQAQYNDSNRTWFLPHFAVINPNKPGKVRPVFDAAAKTQGVALNDNLLTGPDLLQSLLGLLWRFRLKRIGVSADIRDMFLRIKIRKEDQDAQKFIWREPTESGPLKVCKMTSMVFGATCSPCSAIYVKDTNARQFQTEYPASVKAIIENHYVDDYLDSYDYENEAILRATEIIFIHSQGGFDIRSWASNSEAVLKAIPEEKRAQATVKLTPESENQNKTLGMVWETATDTLSFNTSMHKVSPKIATCEECPTKRQMLSVIMSIFDPIGLVTPLTIKGKILLQEVWRTKVDWDDKIEEKQFQKWKKWIQELNLVKACKIPRCYSYRLNSINIDLHTFCDASEKAYCAACYLRYEYKDGEVKITLVAAKAKVTPLKPMSIPRLELQAALLGAKLAKTVQEELGAKIHKKYFWSDSATTLAWIRSDPRKYKPYVGHRLSAIDDLSSPAEWNWVPTAENVADIATRDVESCKFSSNDRWFVGPNFLYQPKDFWPVEKMSLRPAAEAVVEEKVHVVIQKTDFPVPDMSRFSSLKKLTNATALIILFINKCRKTGDQQLTVDLLDKAEKLLIRKSQFDSYNKDINLLKNNSKLKDSPLQHECPYLDIDNLLRARGRIDLVPNVNDTCKRPIILDHSHPYTKLLILNYHKQQNHASTETVLNEIRQIYYISKLRSTLRLISYHCQFCKIRRATPSVPIMGDLPLCRLDHHKRPFTHCGLDYFGPIEVSIGRRREKRYGALFTCMVTRAVHVEIAASLTSDSVIMAIRRMIGRRGCPTDIYSDNGTNFRGAEAELKKAWTDLTKDANFQEEMLTKKIKWHFIPATAANMGGAWERLVQSIKKALYATLKERTPREETLATLLVEAEHTVNSRPITHVSDDVNDPEALTPNHFLLGASSGVAVPGKFDNKDLMLRKQWKIAQRLADMFWQRWLKEYLPTLLPRTGSDCDEDKDLKTGDLVVIADGSLPRNMWPRGLIKSVHPGKDNRVRVVDVATAGGVFRRPSNKIIRLPVEADCVSHS